MVLEASLANVLRDTVVHDVKIKMVVLVNHVKMVVFVSIQVVVHIHVNAVRVTKDKIVNKVLEIDFHFRK
jgi:hypothetical protein